MTTIPQQQTIKQYIADGVTDEYVVPFYTPISVINDSPALSIYVQAANATPNPTADIQIWSVDYIYTPNADPITGGTLTFLANHIPANGSIITISRNVPAELSVDFADARNFSGQNLDNALFELLLIEQQNKTYALNRNLSYIVNSYIPDANVEANTQLPVLGNLQIWQGDGTGVVAVTLEENPDVSTLRSQLEGNAALTAGATIVGYYNAVAGLSTTVESQLDSFIVGTDIGIVNALALTVTNSLSTYRKGMVIKITPANTNTSLATINFNSLGAKNIYRDASTPSQPGDLIINKPASLFYDGTRFIIENLSSIPSGTGQDFMGGTVPPGFLLCDGTAVSRTVYASLFAAISTTWGIGNGSSTFNLPDFRRRTSVGSGGSGSGELGNAVGNTGGDETVALTGAQNGPHTHNIICGGNGGTAFIAKLSSSSDELYAVNSSGSGDPHNNIQPSAIVTKIIKI